MVGRTLSHYRVLEKLGEGGMGEVYLAEDSKLERPVALKVLPSELASSRERLQRFEREAKAVAILNHPNIVHVYSVEESEGLHFFTMELVEGESLSDVIPPEGFPLDQFFDLAIPLADALSEAHEQGIVHRDLKPANVMVDGKGRPKILDFGLAKLRQREMSADFSELPTEVMTEEGKVLGTYPYMSPEQVEGKSVDHRSDVFSFGTMLYEMATGHRPFQGANPASLMSSILRDNPVEVHVEREALPRHLGRVIGRCLEKGIDDRYQRAKDLKKDLEELEVEVRTGRAMTPQPVRKVGHSRRWWLMVGVGLLLTLLAVAAAVITRPWEQESGSGAESQIKSLAVLPLENLSGDPEQDYFADGITGGLIADLSRISALRVISRQSAMQFKNADLSLPEIARQLNVEALIEGSVLPTGDRVRVTAQLVQADPEQHLWADTYERDAKDILRLLSEITETIVEEVEVVISPVEKGRLKAAREVNPDAFRLYLRGMQQFDQYTFDGAQEAAETLRQAVDMDPSFAEAWAGLGVAYFGIVYWAPANTGDAVREVVFGAMNEALDKALAIDPSIPLAHAFKGYISFSLLWDWALAEQEFRRAIESGPGSSRARVLYALFLSAMGRDDEALREAEVAEQLDPLSPGVLRLVGDVHHWVHDFEGALAFFQMVMELSPGDVGALGMRALTLTATGREEEAVAAWQDFQRAVGYPELADLYEGKTIPEVNRIWLQSDQVLTSPPAGIAFAHLGAGNRDEALEYLEKAYATRDDPAKTPGWQFAYLKVDPAYEALRTDPRFQDLLKRMNLAD